MKEKNSLSLICKVPGGTAVRPESPTRITETERITHRRRTMSPTKPRRRSAPHSTVEKFSQCFLPPAFHAFLFGQSEASLASYLVARALFGVVSGAVLFLCIAHNLPLTTDMKLVAGSLFTCVCVVLGALSSSFRCSALLVLPSMLGSSGRRYLMLLMMSVLYSGPVSNIQRNTEAAAMSVSCNLDLQVRHSRILWREAIKPFIMVTQELVDDKTEFQSETQSVDSKFQSIRDELVLQYGYDRFTSSSDGNSTQEQFASKTIMQCDSVVEKGVERCVDWFNGKLAECMEAIPVPVINHILCVFMRFHFLCDVLRVMTPWCRENVPVEGNFGQLYDQLNTSISLLSREFSVELLVEEEQQQEVLEGDLVDQEFTQSVTESFKKLTTTSKTVLEVLQLLLCFTFITIFIQAFVYLRSYKNDVFFDNIYITTYFRQIDKRRKRVGKRVLLPLKSLERKSFIFPWSPKIYPEEFNQVMSGMFQVISVLMLSLVLFAVDFALFRVLDIISRHTITQFNVISSHHVDIRVDGDSMMAHLLRTTISAFNSSSSFDLHSDNLECVPHISPLPFGAYVSCTCCIVLLMLLSFVQVYTNRLRRVISAFYYPKREKKRVLFLYNLQLRRRIISSKNQIVSKRQKTVMVFQRLASWGRHLFQRH